MFQAQLLDRPRVLDLETVDTLDDYVDRGGGRGLDAARRLGAASVVEEIEASGLRGRGGAGFPTGTKWRTVAGFTTSPVPDTVVVNAAEGEPGTFKDRAILRRNPYRVFEGALVAALAVGGADRVVVAVKESFTTEIERLNRAMAQLTEAGWTEGVVDFEILAGPGEYLFGEETALLEVLNGRAPFPRIAPPYRHGADDVGHDTPAPGGAVMAAVGDTTVAPPTLVNNVETLANVPGILAEGADWFRELGTDGSPGTVVCTITGDTRRHGVAEVAMGTPLADVVDAVGGGAREGRHLLLAVSGVANPLLPASRFDAPLSYEGMADAGSGLGAAGFLVFDDTRDPVAVAQGISHFLAVESCGQCAPCKGDGLLLDEHLVAIRNSEAAEGDLAAVHDKVATITEGARCYLAHQHQQVVASLLQHFDDAVRRHVDGVGAGAPPILVAPIVDMVGDEAAIDETQAAKRADWSYGDRESVRWPASERNARAEERPG